MSSNMSPSNDSIDKESTPDGMTEMVASRTHFVISQKELEPIHNVSRVPGTSNYIEKNGLRTEGDGLDHTSYNPRSIKFIMTCLGCSFALTGSQINSLLYLTLGTKIAKDLNATGLQVWMFSANIVATGALAPFVGPLADLFGRKTLFLIGLACSIIGSILSAIAPDAAGFIAGQVFFGFGSVMQELLSIAVVGEIVPTAKRSFYAALILCAIIPWAPGTLYANWIAERSWRWIGLVLAIWNAITFALLAIFYHPPPRVNTLGLSLKEKLGRIDWIGGFLLTIGTLMFLIGLNWGGEQYAWNSSRVISFLTIGGLLVILFGFWEKFGAPYPLYPRRIIHAPRPFISLMIVIFAASINYIGLVMFWPIQSVSVYGSDRFQTGVNTLPIGLCILGGAILSATLLGLFAKRTTFIMTFFCVMQTVAAACLVLADPNDIRTALPSLCLSLIGTGGVMVPNQIIVTVITPDDLIASVTALTVGIRAQSQVIGIAIFYNEFIRQITKRAYTTVLPVLLIAGVDTFDKIEGFITGLASTNYDELAKGVPGLVASATEFAAGRKAEMECFAGALNWVYYITIPFGVVACVAAACMGDVSRYMDDHVAVVL